MHDWESQAHVRWDCIYHIVIVPKYRKRVLFGKTRKKVGVIIRELCRQRGVELVILAMRIAGVAAESVLCPAPRAIAIRAGHIVVRPVFPMAAVVAAHSRVDGNLAVVNEAIAEPRHVVFAQAAAGEVE